MTLNQIEYFIQVAEHGSFSKAALVLGVAQPALSRQVRALETELHETLFLRNGRGVELTEAGRRLLEHGQGILHLVAQARDDLSAHRNEPVGQIVVAMPPTQARLLTLPLIEAFRASCPRARLVVMEGFSTHLTEWLVSGRADLALVYNPEPLAALEILPLREERLVLLSPAGAAPPGPLTLAGLSRYPLVMPQRGQVFRKRMEDAAAMAGVQLRVDWEVSSVPAILDLVAAGLGHAALGEDALRAFEHPERLAVTPFADARVHTTLCLVTPALKRSTPLTQRTAALLMKLVREPRPR
ncbi:LysR family transcriptional regulator [Roseateles saccharophilus]|uniref:LysR family nitrogen assimilation transcriptional regulator n=1 Tax=Roseateles saccharophilus TaxID=304 RepID=A0A4R3UTJ4_ROSSA|nr:LysR family transcriptional regulator [Roseateles saccharophilus]MDG0832728.1 LysR family transcriptional regulator [Roseateles saccharophilus]TCU95336.1 LysR family nitrogen assimilation transcriptional regulator [Roseateles saccharophilus]